MLLKREIRGGKDRAYYTPCPLNEKGIPEISGLIAHPEENAIFIDSVTMNHKGLNWKVYRKLSSSNYKSFIYAFACKIREQPTYFPTTWQLDSNAKRLEKELKKHNIELFLLEKEILKTCSIFTKSGLTIARREKLSSIWQHDLAILYLG